MSDWSQYDQDVANELFDSIFIASHLCGETLHFLPLCQEHRVNVLSVMGSIDVDHITLVTTDHCIICQRKTNYGKLAQEPYPPSTIQQKDSKTSQEVFYFGRKTQG